MRKRVTVRKPGRQRESFLGREGREQGEGRGGEEVSEGMEGTREEECERDGERE